MTKKQIKEIAKQNGVEIKKISIERKKIIRIELAVDYFYNLEHNHPVILFIQWKLREISWENAKIWKDLKDYRKKVDNFKKEVEKAEPESSKGFEDADRWFVPNVYIFVE